MLCFRNRFDNAAIFWHTLVLHPNSALTLVFIHAVYLRCMKAMSSLIHKPKSKMYSFKLFCFWTESILQLNINILIEATFVTKVFATILSTTGQCCCVGGMSDKSNRH